MARFLKAGNPYDGWRKAVKTVMAHGEDFNDERGGVRKEVPDLIIEIADPLLQNKIHPYWEGEKLQTYIDQMQKPDTQGFIYTYGDRWVNWDAHINQIELVIKRLKNDNSSTRAVISTWDPMIDHHIDEVPCILLIDFIIRKGKLKTTVLWRSNDIWGAYYPNIMGIIGIIKRVAGELAVDVGSLTTHGVSAHIYDVNFKEAEALSKKQMY